MISKLSIYIVFAISGAEFRLSVSFLSFRICYFNLSKLASRIFLCQDQHVHDWLSTNLSIDVCDQRFQSVLEHSPILSPRWQRSLPARLEEGSRALDKHGPNLVGSVCGERGEAFFKNLSVKVLLGKVSETYFLGWIWVHTLYLMWTKEYIALGRGVKISREGKDYWLKAKSVLRCLTNMERSFRCCAMTTCDHLVGSPQVMCLQLAPLLTVSSFEICRIRACFTSLVLSQFL